LEAELLRNAVYELGYELNNRPDWVKIPIQAVTELMNQASTT
jgi:predicted trehalose synthase